MTSETPAAELREVTFAYKPGLPVLERASLLVERDDYLGIVGPNGSGKTTLLRLLLGLLSPTRGTVAVFGRPPSEVRYRVGYVPQHARIDLEVPATALDVVLMGRLRMAPWGSRFGRRHRERALAALERVGVESLAGRRLSEMSGGQRQRVLIARALVGEADLLLLDEPTAGVDLHAEEELMELLAELNQSIGVVIVSHDVTMMSNHLKRVAFVSNTVEVRPASSLRAPHSLGDLSAGDGPAIDSEVRG